MPVQLANHSGTTLNGTINSSVTSLAVTSSTGLPSSGTFHIVIDSEIMLVTAISGTTLTVQRAQESTTAASHTSGATVEHVITAGVLDKLRSDHLPIGTVEGRLTLVSGDAVPSADQSAKGTLYFSPYTGKRLCLYDGTVWRSYVTDEISIAFSGSANAIYDVFAYYNSGSDAVALEFSAAWSSDTARNSAISRQDGVWVKSSDTSRRYLGTVRLTGTNQCSDTRAQRFLFNCYNRVERPLKITDTGSTYTYSSTTIRQARATSSNKVECVIGLAEVMVYTEVTHSETITSGFGMVGIGANATTTFDNQIMFRHGLTNIPTNMAILIHYPAIGYNYYSWNEKSNSATSTTFATYTANEFQMGMRGHLEI